ncbi:MAG: hypothetical protein MI924_26005, partial [Chloroflexales bacterium]|nr:hypothetical protein [Chloroflexales bacterium]
LTRHILHRQFLYHSLHLILIIDTDTVMLACLLEADYPPNGLCTIGAAAGIVSGQRALTYIARWRIDIRPFRPCPGRLC